MLSALLRERGKVWAFERDQQRFVTLEKMVKKAGCKSELMERRSTNDAVHRTKLSPLSSARRQVLARRLPGDQASRPSVHKSPTDTSRPLMLCVLPPVKALPPSWIPNEADLPNPTFLQPVPASFPVWTTFTLPPLYPSQTATSLVSSPFPASKPSSSYTPLRFPQVTQVAYSTCSVWKEEDEDVVRGVLERKEVKKMGWRLKEVGGGLSMWKRRGRAAEGLSGKKLLSLPPSTRDLTLSFCLVQGQRWTR